MSNYKKPLFVMFTLLSVLGLGSVPAFATAATYEDFSAVITAVTGQVSVATVVGILSQAAAISIGLVFMWWGVRKVSRVLFSAFRKGRFSV